MVHMPRFPRSRSGLTSKDKVNVSWLRDHFHVNDKLQGFR